MDDKYDLVGFFLSKDGLLRSAIIGALEGTPLEESAGSLSFAAATFALTNVVFLMLFFSQFAILWIERKAVARMQDGTGPPRHYAPCGLAKTALRPGSGGTCCPLALENRSALSTNG